MTDWSDLTPGSLFMYRQEFEGSETYVNYLVEIDEPYHNCTLAKYQHLSGNFYLKITNDILPYLIPFEDIEF